MLWWGSQIWLMLKFVLLSKSCLAIGDIGQSPLPLMWVQMWRKQGDLIRDKGFIWGQPQILCLVSEITENLDMKCCTDQRCQNGMRQRCLENLFVMLLLIGLSGASVLCIFGRPYVHGIDLFWVKTVVTVVSWMNNGSLLKHLRPPWTEQLRIFTEMYELRNCACKKNYIFNVK